MTQRINILLPVGRLVLGSLYEPQTTDANNQPMVYKSGTNAGKPRVVFFCAVAIAKKTEKNWYETPWGQEIYSVAQKGFPGGQWKSKNFHWKITDGDNDEPNKVGKKPCEREGFKGHWVLNLSSGHQSKITKDRGTKIITDEKGFINLGDYIQVYISVSGNNSLQQPGVYLNHHIINFNGYGDRIFVGVDPASVGFDDTTNTASVTPKDQITSSMFDEDELAYPDILNPQQKIMTEKAKGVPYNDFIAKGWTDEALIAKGLMLA